jgi:hypothetical protein
MFVSPLHKLCKQWKLHNLLNIVNIFKKLLTFHLKEAKTFCSTQIIKKNAEALLDASKKIGLEVNSKKTKYCVEQKVFAFLK